MSHSQQIYPKIRPCAFRENAKRSKSCMQTPVMLTVRVHDSTTRKNPEQLWLVWKFCLHSKNNTAAQVKIKNKKIKNNEKNRTSNNSANTCTPSILKIGVAPKYTGIKA